MIKRNPWRRIEILFEKKPSFHKKFWLIYHKVLSVWWLNFTVVKYDSKISIIYHQIKFRKGVINRSSIKNLHLKILQYSQENTCVRVSFQIKMQAFSPKTLLKRSFNTGFFLFKNTCFEEHLWTAVWTFSFMSQ